MFSSTSALYFFLVKNQETQADTNDVIEKYNSLLDDYENLESDYYELLDE